MLGPSNVGSVSQYIRTMGHISPIPRGESTRPTSQGEQPESKRRAERRMQISWVSIWAFKFEKIWSKLEDPVIK